MTLFWRKQNSGAVPLLVGGPSSSGPLSLPFASALAALSPGSNGMAPPLCLPSPTLGK